MLEKFAVDMRDTASHMGFLATKGALTSTPKPRDGSVPVLPLKTAQGRYFLSSSHWFWDVLACFSLFQSLVWEDFEI